MSASRVLALLPDISANKITDLAVRSRSPKKTRTTPQPIDHTGQTPRPSKDEIALWRNSQRQNVCVAMLRQGFHLSFQELLSVLQRFEETRQAGGPDNALWYLPPLQEQPHKLLTLQTHLTCAETAFRTGNFVKVYEEQLALAQYFTGPEEGWISLHFHLKALASAQKVKTDGGRKEAEANANLARLYLEQGQLGLAMEHYEAFHSLALDKPWWDAAGHTLDRCAREGLCAVCIQLAQGELERQEFIEAIQVLNKALNIAKEGDDQEMQGDVSYWLGLAYHGLGELEIARKYLTTSLNVSTVLGHIESQGRAFKAVAKALESDGKLSEAVQHLEKLADVSHTHRQQENLEEACMNMGIIYCKRGEYERGVESLQKAYDIARATGSVGSLQRAQACVGMADAQRMLPAFAAHLNGGRSHDNNIQPIITWKDSRHNTFDQSHAASGKEKQEATRRPTPVKRS